MMVEQVGKQLSMERSRERLQLGRPLTTEASVALVAKPRPIGKLHPKLRSSPLVKSARPKVAAPKLVVTPRGDGLVEGDGDGVERRGRPAWNSSTLDTLYSPRRPDTSPPKSRLLSKVWRGGAVNLDEAGKHGRSGLQGRSQTAKHTSRAPRAISHERELIGPTCGASREQLGPGSGVRRRPDTTDGLSPRVRGSMGEGRGERRVGDAIMIPEGLEELERPSTRRGTRASEGEEQVNELPPAMDMAEQLGFAPPGGFERPVTRGTGSRNRSRRGREDDGPPGTQGQMAFEQDAFGQSPRGEAGLDGDEVYGFAGDYYEKVRAEVGNPGYDDEDFESDSEVDVLEINSDVESLQASSPIPPSNEDYIFYPYGSGTGDGVGSGDLSADQSHLRGSHEESLADEDQEVAPAPPEPVVPWWTGPRAQGDLPSRPSARSGRRGDTGGDERPGTSHGGDSRPGTRGSRGTGVGGGGEGEERMQSAGATVLDQLWGAVPERPRARAGGRSRGGEMTGAASQDEPPERPRARAGARSRGAEAFGGDVEVEPVERRELPPRPRGASGRQRPVDGLPGSARPGSHASARPVTRGTDDLSEAPLPEWGKPGGESWVADEGGEGAGGGGGGGGGGGEADVLNLDDSDEECVPRAPRACFER